METKQFKDKDGIGRGSITTVGYVIIFSVGYDSKHGASIQVTPGKAREIAEWILDNVPEGE